MGKDEARDLIMRHMTVRLLGEFKPESEDFWEWLDWAASVAVRVHAEKGYADRRGEAA